MLKSLIIENIALIEKLEIDFIKQLNILSGETGAGKSIILNSLAAVLGDKMQPDTIRTGATDAYVEAIFDISKIKYFPPVFADLDIDVSGGELIIRREIATDGKSKCKVNSRTVLPAQVKEIAELLVDIHSQHEHQSLLNVENHIVLLDRFASIDNELTRYAHIYNVLNGKTAELERLKGLEKEKERILELSRFAADEIDSLKLYSGEEEELETAQKKVNSIQKIADLANDAYGELYARERSTINLLERVNHHIQQISAYDNAVSAIADDLSEAAFRLENAKDALREYKSSLEMSPIRAEEIADRLFKIRGLKRKYSCSNIEELLAYSENRKIEVEEINKSLEKIEELEKEIHVLQSEASILCLDISKKRQTAAKKLSELVERELKDLSMEAGRFGVDFKYVSDKNSFVQINGKGVKSGSAGIDRVEFLISTNAGEELRPLKKIASGGELSRIMLALKSVLASLDDVGTLIFDEIDSGIGGQTAFSVGKKLKKLAGDKQIICITHLAQIASMGHANYRVYKFEENGRTKSNIKLLPGEERVKEIARMVGGDDVSDKSLEYARDLISRSNE